MRRTLIAWILACTVCVGLAACGQEPPELLYQSPAQQPAEDADEKEDLYPPATVPPSDSEQTPPKEEDETPPAEEGETPETQKGLHYELTGAYYTVVGYTDEGLTELTVPTSHEEKPVRAIGGGAFARCSLTKITLSEGIERVEGGAFAYAATLREVVFPASLAEIGVKAFNGCTALERVSFATATGWTANGKTLSAEIVQEAAAYLTGRKLFEENCLREYAWSRGEKLFLEN